MRWGGGPLVWKCFGNSSQSASLCGRESRLVRRTWGSGGAPPLSHLPSCSGNREGKKKHQRIEMHEAELTRGPIGREILRSISSRPGCVQSRCPQMTTGRRGEREDGTLQRISRAPPHTPTCSSLNTDPHSVETVVMTGTSAL